MPRAARRLHRLTAVSAAILAVMLVGGGSAAAQDPPAVRAVLFFSPTCGHCEYVINEVLPQIFDANGGTPIVAVDESLAAEEVVFYLATNGTLEILLVDVSRSSGAALFAAATEAFDIDSDGVPRLMVGDRYLIGSGDIPELFPGIVGDALAEGGVDWPAIPGLAAALAPLVTVPTTATTAPSTTAGNSTPTTTGDLPATTSPGISIPGAEESSIGDKWGRDPVGNSIAVIVLLAIAAATLATIHRLRRATSPARPGLEVPVLAVIGIVVAGYLTWVEAGGGAAVCGPVGDCNAVQQSEYARLFGVIPIGLLGIVGYGGILALWVAGRLAPSEAGRLTLARFAVAAAGVLFSIYLTVLEPFVIGATCAWCLTSALTITGIMFVSAPEARRAWLQRRGRVA